MSPLAFLWMRRILKSRLSSLNRCSVYLQGPDDRIADLQKVLDELTEERTSFKAYVDAYKALLTPIRRLPSDVSRNIRGLPAHASELRYECSRISCSSRVHMQLLENNIFCLALPLVPSPHFSAGSQNFSAREACPASGLGWTVGSMPFVQICMQL
ncbi:hypothetical protein K438DRAFT_1822933 [Mycena galopus ATCC 62051]|nr:hypothetical protein K438DRAFT_1822933 [Mycena galopus ATCC 62051]